MVNEVSSVYCDPRLCGSMTSSNKLLGFFSHFVGDGGPPGPQQRRGVRTRRHLGAPALQQFEEFVQDIRLDPLIVRCSVRSLKRPEETGTMPGVAGGPVLIHGEQERIGVAVDA